MEQKSMTAFISAFARAFHAENNSVWVFNDFVARSLFSDAEYRQISAQMSRGIAFFEPDFHGSDEEEELRRIVDRCLSPTPLGRAAFAEKALQTAVRIGAGQYLIFAAGYDTFACRRPDWAKTLTVFEIDLPAVAADKQQRLQSAGIRVPEPTRYVSADLTDSVWPDVLRSTPGFRPSARSFCSLLGLSYYLAEADFAALIDRLGRLLPSGSTLVLDYPLAGADLPNRQSVLARGAGEPMQAAYRPAELERLLAERGFLIYEHLDADEITAQYFGAYNAAHPDAPMTAPPDVAYCLAVRRD